MSIGRFGELGPNSKDLPAVCPIRSNRIKVIRWYSALARRRGTAQEGGRDAKCLDSMPTRGNIGGTLSEGADGPLG